MRENDDDAKSKVFAKKANRLLRNYELHCERSEALQLHHCIAIGTTAAKTRREAFGCHNLKTEGYCRTSHAPPFRCSFWIT